MINLNNIKEFCLSFLTGLLVMMGLTLALGIVTPSELMSFY